MFSTLILVGKAAIGLFLMAWVFFWIRGKIVGGYWDLRIKKAEAKLKRLSPPQKPHTPGEEPEPDEAMNRSLGFTALVTFIFWLVMAGSTDPIIGQIDATWPWWVLGPEAGLIYYLHRKGVGRGWLILILVVVGLQVFQITQLPNAHWHDGNGELLIRAFGDWLVSCLRAPFEILKKLFSK